MAEHKSGRITIEAMGDGTYQTHSGMGKPMEHETAAYAAAHFLKHHSRGDHVVIEGHDEGYTTHGVHDGESHTSEHKTMNSAVRSVRDCMGGECEGGGR
jgi:hypothetical protein